MTPLETALGLLETSEKTQDPKQKVRTFCAGIDTLGAASANQSDTAQSELIKNLRLSHARVFLERLQHIYTYKDFGDWLEVLSALQKVRPEINRLIAREDDLREIHDQFIAVWKTEAIALAKSIGITTPADDVKGQTS